MLKIINNKSKILISILVILVVISYFVYYSIQVNSLTKLGYTKQKAYEMVNITTIYNIVSDNEAELRQDINSHTKTLDNLGISSSQVSNLFNKSDKLVVKEDILDDYASKLNEKMNKKFDVLKKQAEIFKIEYKLKDNELYKQVDYLENLVNNKIDNLIDFLSVNGFSTKQINALENIDGIKKANDILSAVEKEKKELKKNNGFQSAELHKQAMRMFRLTNEYRASQGLKPYIYNYKKQSCVFKEASAYAKTRIPHNWVCPTANEVASLASVKSDYVAIAMKFLTTDPSHEATMSGNYKSASIAFVEKKGIVYMIMDVFY